MRRKNLVARADEVVAAKFLDVDHAVRREVDAIQKYFCAGGVGVLRNLRDVHDSSDNIGSYRTCHQAGG